MQSKGSNLTDEKQQKIKKRQKKRNKKLFPVALVHQFFIYSSQWFVSDFTGNAEQTRTTKIVEPEEKIFYNLLYITIYVKWFSSSQKKNVCSFNVFAYIELVRFSQNRNGNDDDDAQKTMKKCDDIFNKKYE